MSKTEAETDLAMQSKQDEGLSQNQIRARQQHRLHGRFTSDPSRPGRSASTTDRMIRMERQNRKSICERNVAQLVDAVMCKGSRFDFVPSSVEGPLTAIVDMVLKPQFRVPSRMVPAIAKKVYLERTERRTVPRRNILKNGEIVKRRVAVFSDMRFPRMDVPPSLERLIDLLMRFDEAGTLQDESVAACMNRLSAVFNSYDPSKCEYEGYPSCEKEESIDEHPEEEDRREQSLDNSNSERTDATSIDTVDTPMQH